jgi:glycosyltransferase involved in cell wall biosynthesis
VKVLLIGNYGPDRQESMLRYAQMLRAGLLEAGHHVTLAVPRPVLNRRGRPASGVWKWIGYLDKMVLSAADLARAARQADVVHVCDHGNSFYIPGKPRKPYVVTCHDLLAVRGSLGESTDVTPSFTGHYLQRLILDGLKRATAIACVSGATMRDARRLLGDYRGQLIVAPNSLNYPYRKLEVAEVRRRLDVVSALPPDSAYVLLVGGNSRRKNREAALRAVAGIAGSWNGRLVVAGEPLSPEQRRLAQELGVMERIVELGGVSNELLEALYNGALALLFPSRFEGFGWPIAEAQACGCPVICSSSEPLPEVAGAGAILCNADDHAAFGRAIAALARNPAQRDALVTAGFANASRYDRPQLIEQFVSLYERARTAA